MKIAIKESKRGNIAAMRKRLKTVSQRRGVDKTKSFRFHPVNSLPKHVKHTSYMGG